MIAIACVDKNNGIGKNGKLLISIPEDMKYFKEQTINSVVVMGRKTLFSFKNKEPLKNRINIVLTNNKNLQNEYAVFDNIFFANSLKELNELLDKFKNKKIYLIGGADIYNKLIDNCDTALITKVNKSFDADVFFPNLLEKGFVIENISENYIFEDITYNFITYKKQIKDTSKKYEF